MKTNDTTETPPDSDIIRADIKQTRESMDQTLDELGTRMKPRHLMDEMLGYLNLDQMNGQKLKEKAGAAAQSAGQAARRAGRALTDVVREHPIPTLLISAGVAWAFYETYRRSQNRNGHHNGNGHHHPREEGPPHGEMEAEWEAQGWKAKAEQGLGSVQGSLQSTAQDVKEKVTSTAQAVGQKATQVKDQVVQKVQQGYQAGRDKFVQTSQTHPLHVGLGFLAAGVLLGLALPTTRKEDQWVGQAADRVKGQAKATGQDLLNRGKTVATAAAEAVKKTATEQGLTPQALKEKLQRVASETQEAAKRSAEQQGLTPGGQAKDVAHG